MKLLTNINLITEKDTVIVANNRQVLAFKKQYSTIKKGVVPNIVSWDNLLISLWEKQDNYYEKWRLIDKYITYYMFHYIIKNSNIKTSENIVTEVIENYNWQRKQRVPLQKIVPQNSMQAYFLTWIEKYKQQKTKYNLIDIFDLTDKINPSCTIPYYQYGFKVLTKEQQILFAKLQVKTLEIETKPYAFSCKIFECMRDEVRSSVEWAYNIKQKQPAVSIAIIVPELEKNYHQFTQQFNKIFTQNLLQTQDKIFNISLGKPLTHYSIVKDLYLSLTLTQQILTSKIDVQALIKLINSPYFKIGKTHLKINDILKLEQAFISKSQLLSMDDSLTSIIDMLELNQDNYYHNWLTVFDKIFKIFQFNQVRNMTSNEYQIFNKYLSSVLIFNKLSVFKRKVNFLTAINEFYLMLSRVIFQPQSGVNQIQIMGSLEAQGLSFNYAWVVGVNHKILPPSLKPLRYLPLEICQKYQIPRSDFEHILMDAQSSLDYLALTASKPIMSYAKIIDNLKVQGSPLIQWSGAAIIQISKNEKQLQNLQIIKDDKINKLTKLEIKQGVKVLKEQMQCGFKGFANRLEIDNFNHEYIGISNLQKGKILHKALELLYQNITSKQQLEQLLENDLDTFITKAIDDATQDYPKNSFYKIEYQQVLTKIHQLLVLEKLRDNWHIKALEKTQNINISDLKFDIRTDRIDINDKGEIIIFDYKSGKVETRKWCGVVLDEPQLPIYALVSKPNALCFIGFKNDVKYVGMAENDEILPTKKATCYDNNSWQVQNKIWRTILTQAANDFKNGMAEVSPTKDACLYCKLDSFCRIQP